MTAGAAEPVDLAVSDERQVARKAIDICSNPDCQRVTGFQIGKVAPRATAQAAHILPAAECGPRWDAEPAPSEGSKLRRGVEGNEMRICFDCHNRAHSDPEEFPAELLLAWKGGHEERVASLLGFDLKQTQLRLGGGRDSRDLALELLLRLDAYRSMYPNEFLEFPPR